jgi:hypothetical protein
MRLNRQDAKPPRKNEFSSSLLVARLARREQFEILKKKNFERLSSRGPLSREMRRKTPPTLASLRLGGSTSSYKGASQVFTNLASLGRSV